MTTREFRETYFYPDSKPTELSIRNWIKRGELNGRKLGGIYYVIINDDVNKAVENVDENIEPNFSRYLRKGKDNA